MVLHNLSLSTLVKVKQTRSRERGSQSLHQGDIASSVPKTWNSARYKPDIARFPHHVRQPVNVSSLWRNNSYASVLSNEVMSPMYLRSNKLTRHLVLQNREDDYVKRWTQGRQHNSNQVLPARLSPTTLGLEHIKQLEKRAELIADICPKLTSNSHFGSRPEKVRNVKAIRVILSGQETVKGVFLHRTSKTSYCYVPKAGCTFWIRIFFFLHV